METCKLTNLLIFSLLVLCTSALELPSTVNRVTDGTITSISLKTYNSSSDNDEAFLQLVSIDGNANFKIQATDIPSDVYFVIIQVHTYMHNVSMYYDVAVSDRLTGNHVNGSNIGLLIETNAATNAVVQVSNTNSESVGSLIAILAYTKDAPQPGGCNMEFNVEKSPFQKLTFNDKTITVDAQPASIPPVGGLQLSCEKFPIAHDAYRVYMPEHDFSNFTYFTSIANMLTVSDIEKNAALIPGSIFNSAMRRIYSVYPGTGSVYGMVAYFGEASSAYVPIVTYGCDSSSWANSCSYLTNAFTKVLSALVFFIGVFVAMRGQNFFKTSMILLGLLFGGYIGYTIGLYYETFNITGIIVIGMITGIVMSSLWLLLWMSWSSPIPSLTLTGVTLGSFFFYIFYFAVPAGAWYLEMDSYYWLIFTTFVVMTFLVFSVVPLIGNILCFTILGSYVSILAVDYYVGSNLKYILINSIRRSTDDDFKYAVIQPPFQRNDIILTLSWAFIVIVGIFRQYSNNLNRLPFPPSTSNTARYTERTAIFSRRRYEAEYQTFHNPPVFY
ncbi:hypothetical protein TKK_0002657 [Trichogramma kaykai]|uniref:TM7S3/TM198-like domain-containing protein n=1 Tax=Trichogramma kaykai TaxID=54128 RepID=A0ABD2XRZ2_9HYME